MQKWEYMVVEFSVFNVLHAEKYIKPKIDKLGQEGWEIASVTLTTNDYGATNGAICWFKRPIED